MLCCSTGMLVAYPAENGSNIILKHCCKETQPAFNKSILGHSKCCVSTGEQTQEAHHELITHLEDFLKVRRHGLRLISQPTVRADAHTVLSGHRQDGRPIVLQDRLSARSETEVPTDRRRKHSHTLDNVALSSGILYRVLTVVRKSPDSDTR